MRSRPPRWLQRTNHRLHAGFKYIVLQSSPSRDNNPCGNAEGGAQKKHLIFEIQVIVTCSEISEL
jgi:hypothetical protein